MAVTLETYNLVKAQANRMSDKILLEKYLFIQQSGYNFEREIYRNEILWRMGYGRGGYEIPDTTQKLI